MEMVFDQGLQVEWIEFQTVLEWMLYIEGASVQASVMVQPHIVDTAIMYVHFLSSTQALPWAGSQLDKGSAPG